jgi:hypothetical protein
MMISAMCPFALKKIGHDECEDNGDGEPLAVVVISLLAGWILLVEDGSMIRSRLAAPYVSNGLSGMNQNAM